MKHVQKTATIGLSVLANGIVGTAYLLLAAIAVLCLNPVSFSMMMLTPGTNVVATATIGGVCGIAALVLEKFFHRRVTWVHWVIRQFRTA